MTRETSWTDPRYPGVEFRQTSQHSVIGVFDSGHDAFYYSRDEIVANVAMAEIWKSWIKGRAGFASPAEE